MVAGAIKRDVVTTLSDVIGLLLLQSESWNLKELYPKFYNQGKNLVIHLKSCLSFDKKTFEDANDWIGAYCNIKDILKDITFIVSKNPTILEDCEKFLETNPTTSNESQEFLSHYDIEGVFKL